MEFKLRLTRLNENSKLSLIDVRIREILSLTYIYTIVATINRMYVCRDPLARWRLSTITYIRLSRPSWRVMRYPEGMGRITKRTQMVPIVRWRLCLAKALPTLTISTWFSHLVI